MWITWIPVNKLMGADDLKTPMTMNSAAPEGTPPRRFRQCKQGVDTLSETRGGTAPCHKVPGIFSTRLPHG